MWPFLSLSLQRFYSQMNYELLKLHSISSVLLLIEKIKDACSATSRVALGDGSGEDAPPPPRPAASAMSMQGIWSATQALRLPVLTASRRHAGGIMSFLSIMHTSFCPCESQSVKGVHHSKKCGKLYLFLLSDSQGDPSPRCQGDLLGVRCDVSQGCCIKSEV